jgi:hypothetical protein
MRAAGARRGGIGEVTELTSGQKYIDKFTQSALDHPGMRYE